MPRTILMAIGLLALLGGLGLAALWYQQAGAPAAPAVGGTQAIATQSVLVAAHAMPAGTLLRPGDMIWAEVPAATVVGSDILRGSVPDNDYVGAVTGQSFAAQQRVSAPEMVKPGERGFLVAALAPGHVAVSIPVDAVQSTSGLMFPGDRVDVILTQFFNAQANDPGHRSVGETVLRDLRVIAVDQTLVPPAKPATGGAAEMKVPKTVTLEVTERQAAALLVAEQLGKIQLALRGLPDIANPRPAAPMASPPVWAAEVSPALGENGAEPSVTARGAIEVMRGGKIEHLCFTKAGLLPCP